MNAWLAWEPTPLAPWATLALLVAVVVAAQQYFRVRAVAPFALRCAAIGLLMLCVWQPSLGFVEGRGARRSLRIVVDDSLSMNVVDATRSPGAWLRLAEALDRYDASAHASAMQQLDQLRVAIRELRHADEALAAARSSDPISPGERAALSSAREAATGAAQALRASAESAGCSAEALGALDRAEQAITEGSDYTAILAAIDEAAPEIRKQSREKDDKAATDDPAAAEAVQEIRSLSRFELAMAAAARLRGLHPQASTLAGLDGTIGSEPSNTKSALTAALRDACVRASAERAEAVVFISDGRVTESRSLLASAAATGVPVFTLAAAPEDRSPDIRVTRLEARPAVLAGQPVVVRVRVSQRNAPGQSVRLTLSDGERSVERTVQVSGNDSNFDMLWPEIKAPGARLTARVDGLNGEIQTANNAQVTYVAAIGQRQRVLLLAGQSGRDFGELVTALTATAWVDLHRPRVVAGPPPHFENIDEDIRSADVIVMSDMPTGALDAAQWEAIRRAIRERGASLLVLPGDADWLADPDIARELAPLLPITPGPRPVWMTQPVWAVPTRVGADTPFLRLDESADASYRAWLGRPKLGRLLAVGPPSQNARPQLVDRSTQAPLLIDGTAGLGRSMLVLTDQIWQWAPAGEDAVRRFWVGLTDSLYDLPYPVQRDGLSLAIDRVDVSAGRTLFARVRTNDPSSGAVTMSVTANGVTLGTPPMREMLPGSGRYFVPLNLPAGTVEVTVRQARRSVQTSVTVADDAQQELADTTPDNGLLRRIADTTGGAALTLEDIGQLPQLLATQRTRTEHVNTYPLWSSSYGFAAIVACLVMEWALRPRARLA